MGRSWLSQGKYQDSKETSSSPNYWSTGCKRNHVKYCGLDKGSTRQRQQILTWIEGCVLNWHDVDKASAVEMGRAQANWRRSWLDGGFDNPSLLCRFDLLIGRRPSCDPLFVRRGLLVDQTGFGRNTRTELQSSVAGPSRNRANPQLVTESKQGGGDLISMKIWRSSSERLHFGWGGGVPRQLDGMPSSWKWHGRLGKPRLSITTELPSIHK